MSAKFVLGILLICLSVGIISATDLRGRVDGIHAYSQAPFPVAGASVTIYAVRQTQYGPQYFPVATTLTGADGMYYFRNVFPGLYVLQIAQTNYPPFQVFPQAGQDIQPALLSFN